MKKLNSKIPNSIDDVQFEFGIFLLQSLLQLILPLQLSLKLPF